MSALAIALVTRLYALERFPIYFFTDEAIQAISAAHFVDNGFRNTLGELFPTYFQNGQIVNLGTSVYAQVPAYLLFGFSVEATRGTSVLLAVFGMVAVALTLRDVFQLRLWWAGALLLSATPAWFLHSRTAFEAVVAVAMYAWFIYFYLRARTSDPRYLYAAVAFAALTFYAYSATQIVILATAALLVASDLRHHWEHRRVAVIAAVLVLVVALPQLRFHVAHGGEIDNHLRVVNSVWAQDLSLGEKLGRFAEEYRSGVSPRYWFMPDDERDLVRHRMQGWGNALPYALPLVVLGLAVSVRNFRSPAHRAVLISAACAPLGGALAQTMITRDLIAVVPLTLLTMIGLAAALSPLLSRLRLRTVALSLFSSLAAVNVVLAYDGITNGPTWYRDYGLYGMQFGGRQVSAAIREALEQSPASTVMVSSSWANGADTVIRYFLPNEPRITFRTIDAYQFERVPIGERDIFVMPPFEYRAARTDRRFDSVKVTRVVRYPDGLPGFYFVRLRYSPRAGAVFAAERRERRRPQTATLVVDGQRVVVRHSRLDLGAIADIFDGDSFTLARTLEANPAVFRLTFSRPRVLEAVEVRAGTMRLTLGVRVFPAGRSEPFGFRRTAAQTEADPTATLSFGREVRTRVLEVRVGNADVSGPDHVHVRELTLR